jgi:glucuronosyltransferase
VSRLVRDEILPAKDVAVYWIEHVLRHGGTQHLHLSSKKLNFLQKHLIDVIMFLGGAFLLCVILMILGLRCFVKCLFKKSSKQKVQ